MNLVFLGPPGSGKGTQAGLLKEKQGFAVLGMGNILRDEIRRNTSVGTQVKEVMERGLFPENDLVIGLLKAHLLNLLPCDRVLFDGFPRDVLQAQALETILEEQRLRVDLALYLEADEDVLVQRILSRLICTACGAVYALPGHPPKQAGVCDLCQEELIKRQDDQVSVFKERFRINQEKEALMLAFYEARGTLARVDALQPVQQVQEAILALMTHQLIN